MRGLTEATSSYTLDVEKSSSVLMVLGNFPGFLIIRGLVRGPRRVEMPPDSLTQVFMHLGKMVPWVAIAIVIIQSVTLRC